MRARRGFVVIAALIAAPAGAHRSTGNFDLRTELTLTDGVTGVYNPRRRREPRSSIFHCTYDGDIAATKPWWKLRD